jgi:peptidoglycan/LPS O-acetylase OafA/YrhL
MLVNLHLLRFLAAMPVLAYHTAEHVWASGIPREGLLYANHLAGFGGVDVFFVISGFIIWHTTHDENGPMAASRFLRRRIARTYSGYWPFLLLSLFLLTQNQPQVLAHKDWVLSATLIPNPADSTIQLLPGRLSLPVAWTLIYEVYFYLAFGLFIAFRRQADIRVIAVVALVVALAGLYAWQSGVYSVDKLLDASLLFTFYLSPYCLEFLSGCVLGEVYRRYRIRWPLLWLAVGLAMTVVLGWVNAQWFGGRMNLGYYVPVRVLLFTAAAVGYVLWALSLDQQGKHVFPRICLVLGGSTYALYLSHTIWLRYLYDVGVRNWLQEHELTIIGYWISSLLIIGMSAAYYYYVERRLHTGFRRVLGVGRPK